ncbi:MAG: hypothetical protein IKE28_00090 [Solobacterium sp.]|nr:hypothetical protein [Solobacterium sp.]
MKKQKKWLISIAVCFLMCGCRDRSMPNNRVIRQSKTVEDVIQEQTAEQTPETVIETAVPEETEPENTYASVDLDLTKSSETMLYSEVIDIGTNPDSYAGKVIRVEGQYMNYHDDMSANTYPVVIVLDATKCCATGLVFELKEGNYPKDEEEFTVTGILDYAYSDDCPFPVLKEAEIS